MKKTYIKYLMLIALLCLTSCTTTQETETDTTAKSIVIGFSQSGTESSWRKRHTESIRTELEKEGYEVLYRNGYMNQERQIQDIRSFIVYQVDAIVFTPLQEEGWDAILEEAAQADIPVFVVDRHVSVNDSSLFLTHIGPSFKAEGNRAGLYVSNYFREQSDTTINVLELTGLNDTSPTQLRSEGFRETIQRDLAQNNVTIQVQDAISGDFIRRKGKEAIETYIKEGKMDTINVLFSHNDEMTIGALEALEETDIEPGKELIIVTIDAQKEMIDNLKEGLVNCVVECNPEAGVFVKNAINRYLERGADAIPREIYVHETVFSSDMDFSQIPPRNY